DHVDRTPHLTRGILERLAVLAYHYLGQLTAALSERLSDREQGLGAPIQWRGPPGPARHDRRTDGKVDLAFVGKVDVAYLTACGGIQHRPNPSRVGGPLRAVDPVMHAS